MLQPIFHFPMRTYIFLIGIIASFFTSLGHAVPEETGAQFTGHEKTAQMQQTATITLDQNAQIMAGIQTQKLASAYQQPEFIAYGTILSLEPLLKLRQQYLAAKSQQTSAQAKYTETRLNLSRTENLHHQDIVSTRRLQEQQALWQSDKANLEVSSHQQKSVLASSRLEWGEILTELFVLAPNKLTEQFFNQKSQLLQITLPADRRLLPDSHIIYIDEHGQRDTAIKAELISASPGIDPTSQGERYFFKTEGRIIAFGTHITAWIANDGQQMAGVIVPKSAVVWHMDQPLVFIKESNDQFSRRALTEYKRLKEGFFVTGDLRANDDIVTTGAQTLLSQHLKALIPNEDKD